MIATCREMRIPPLDKLNTEVKLASAAAWLPLLRPAPELTLVL